MIKSYIFKPAFSAADPAVIELINTGPLPLTTIPCDPPSPGETLIDLRKEKNRYLLLLTVSCLNNPPVTADNVSMANSQVILLVKILNYMQSKQIILWTKAISSRWLDYRSQ